MDARRERSQECRSKLHDFLQSLLWDDPCRTCNFAKYWLYSGHACLLQQVAVVDSGVSTHSDLDDNVWHNPRERLDGRDNDGEASATLRLLRLSIFKCFRVRSLMPVQA